MAVSAYIVTACFTGLLLGSMHNMYRYLALQRKFKVYFLSLFYFFATVLLAMRIVASILIVKASREYSLTVELEPALV